MGREHAEQQAAGRDKSSNYGPHEPFASLCLSLAMAALCRLPAF